MDNHDAFARLFWNATGNEPYPFQIRFTCTTTAQRVLDQHEHRTA